MKIGPVRIKSRELGLIYPIAKKNGNRVCDEVNNAVRFYANYFDIFEKNKKEKSTFWNDVWISIVVILIIDVLCYLGFSIFYLFVLLVSLVIIYNFLEVWDVLKGYK